MRFLDYQQFFEYISHTLVMQEIDFVIRVKSPWQAIGADAFIYELSKNKMRVPKGIILIIPAKFGFTIDESYFYCSNYSKVKFHFLEDKSDIPTNFFKSKIIFLSAIQNIIGKSNENNKKIYIGTVQHHDNNFISLFCNKVIATKYNPIFIIIDEGLGSYQSRKPWKLITAKTRNTSVISKLKFRISILDYNLFYYIALKYLEIVNMFLFDKKDGVLFPNQVNVQLYKNVLKKRNDKENLIREDIFAIIVTAPDIEEGRIGLDDELKFLKKVIGLVIDKDLNLAIKPHPKESLSKYEYFVSKFSSKKFKIISQGIPMEDVFLRYNIQCIIGYSSTALVNARVLYDIPVISLIDIKNFNKESYMGKYRVIFKKLAENINITYPDRWEDLEKKIEKLKNIKSNI